MLTFDGHTEFSPDFETELDSNIEGDYPEPVVEKYAGIILGWLWKVLKWLLHFIFVKVLLALLTNIYKGIASTATRMWKKATDALADAFGKLIGYFIAALLILVFAMSFTANNYSLSRTFSWNGLVVLYETWK